MMGFILVLTVSPWLHRKSSITDIFLNIWTMRNFMQASKSNQKYNFYCRTENFYWAILWFFGFSKFVCKEQLPVLLNPIFPYTSWISDDNSMIEITLLVSRQHELERRNRTALLPFFWSSRSILILIQSPKTECSTECSASNIEFFLSTSMIEIIPVERRNMQTIKETSQNYE